ncbi:MAG: rhomboid family intramembrane serine protease [Muribaculaceae bacterium]|nr:rhomboid family intramembrane serine protease [Muribaculaceae bacterium]MDE6118644.1 rhomboid family intramembrane serine protease [Muribaculaceae bacterium]MDE6315208.1 rhomboid family intramembrane serine protease [Muribaculaceae bacterium]
MSSIADRIPPVTLNIIIINVIVWLAMLILPSRIGVDIVDIGAMHYITSPDFGVWQWLTYMFMHDTQSFTHLFFNMFGLFMFGSTLERVFGSQRFLFFYITVGIGAALVQEGVYAIWLQHLASSAGFDSQALAGIAKGLVPVGAGREQYMAGAEIYALINAPTIGASGAIYGILLAFGMIFPNMPLYFFFIPIPIKAKWMVIAYGVLELTLGVTGVQSGVAHFAHLGGMIVALLLIVYWRKKGVINREPLY